MATTFREFTFINADQCEVMIGINVNTGAIISMYCYADHIPETDNLETGATHKTPIVTLGKNPLFVHIKNKALTFRRIVENGWIALVDDSDPDYNADVTILEKCHAKYNIPNSVTFY